MSWALAGTAAPSVQMPENANKTKFSSTTTATAAHSGWQRFALPLSGGALMQHYVSELIDLLLALVAAWMFIAVIFVIYAYFARLQYPVSESVFGRVVVISFFIITTSIWLPIIVGALALSLIGNLWSRFRTKSRVDSANRHRSCSPGGADRRGW
jgi:hypothetical protein